MKKIMFKLLLGFLMFLPNIIQAQLDDVHYIPPSYGRVNVDKHYLIISTLSTAAVNYTVTTGSGVAISAGVVSRLTPQTLLLGNGYAATGMINYGQLNGINDEGAL